MWKIFKYGLYDMVRNRWMFIYTGFFFLLTFALLLLNSDLSKVVISLTNVVLVIAPLIGILFGTMHYYNSKEFVELLLALPLSRTQIFSGLYFALATALVLSAVIGIGIPMALFQVWASTTFDIFLVLLFVASVLSVIFSLLAFMIAIRWENKVKGFGIAIFTWLFFAVIYDGLFLLLLLVFRDYPLERFTLGMTLANPIDLSRILVLLRLDVSAMMGYTGAVLQKFLGSMAGSITIVSVLIIWMVLPYLAILRMSAKKDF